MIQNRDVTEPILICSECTEAATLPDLKGIQVIQATTIAFNMKGRASYEGTLHLLCICKVDPYIKKATNKASVFTSSHCETKAQAPCCCQRGNVKNCLFLANLDLHQGPKTTALF